MMNRFLLALVVLLLFAEAILPAEALPFVATLLDMQSTNTSDAFILVILQYSVAIPSLGDGRKSSRPRARLILAELLVLPRGTGGDK
jgi:hypothetical protein